MIENLKKEVIELVSGIQDEKEKWLAVHRLLNRYKQRDDFCEIRREICAVMKKITGEP